MKLLITDYIGELFNSNTETLSIIVSDKYGNKWDIKLGDETGDFIKITATGKNGNLEIHPIVANSIKIL